MNEISKPHIIEVFVPNIGDFKDVPVIEILAQLGSIVAVDDTIVVLESDKATIEVPSPAAGTVKEIGVKIGDKVSQGSILVLLEIGPAIKSFSTEPSLSAEVSETIAVLENSPESIVPTVPLALSATTTQMLSGVIPHASPSIRRFARELGVDLGRLRGTGSKGRIQKIDVTEFVKNAVSSQPTRALNSDPAMSNEPKLPPWPQIDFARFGVIERAPISKIKQISGANLSRNSVVIPHVTNFAESDITELEKFRSKVNKERQPKGEKLTILAFMIKAAVVALKRHPTFNASLDRDELIIKRYFHIGFAADTPNGLVVPVIKDADTKDLTVIAEEAVKLAEQARKGKLKLGEMEGGCFTISSLGGISGNGFTPIINAPEVAILGAARAKMTPVWDGENFQPRLIMPISLSWDHRVIDGAEAARFLVTFTSLLDDFRRVSL